MLTTTAKAVLDQACYLARLNPNQLDVANEWPFLRQTFSDILAELWRDNWWLELMVIEAFDTVTGDTDDVYVPWTAGDRATFHDVCQVFDSDPRLAGNAVTIDPQSRWERPDGLGLFGTFTQVWIEYRKDPPVISGDTFSASTVYTAGQQVYWGSDFYDVLATTTAGETPATASAKFSKIEIPAAFARALALGTAAGMVADPELVQARTAQYSAARSQIGLAKKPVTVRFRTAR